MKNIKLVIENSYLMGYDTNNKPICYYPLTKEAKELDLPLLPPLLENWYIESKKYKEEIKNFISKEQEVPRIIGFIDGYKAAQSKQLGKMHFAFSLEDMKKAIEMAREGTSDLYSEDIAFSKSEEEIIQSLSTQQLPKEFVISDKFSTFEENIKNGEYKW